MFYNVTMSPTSDPLSVCSWQGIAINNIAAFYPVAISASVIIAVLSPVAVAGNALVLAAIWKNRSLRTPSYILLSCLAFTGLCTGLITQPLYVVGELICLEKPQLSFLRHAIAIDVGFGVYFTTLTLILITLMSIERWLHMTRRSLLNVRRCCIIVTIVSLLSIPFVVFRSLYFFKGNDEIFSDIIAFTLLLVCLITTSISYLKVYRIIRHHQQQIQANGTSQNFGQPAINLAKYKNSVCLVLYILVVFYISYVPSVMIIGFSLFYQHSVLELAYKIFVILVFLSSSLNPLICLWRMNDVRNGVKQLLKKLLCKEN